MRTIACLFAAILVSASPATTQPAATETYEQIRIEGFRVYVSAEVQRDSSLRDQVQELLRLRLLEMKRALPATAMNKLADVPIWLELHDREFAGMCYHPSRDWLRDNGYNPDKAGAVEIGDARHFLDWSRSQPMMVLHEFAHAYHHQVLGYDYAPNAKAYSHAKDAKLYDRVLRNNGRHERAYCMNNDQEYFAEQSEAMFGTNDFFPFVRAELIEHDPGCATMLREAWGISD